MRKRGIKKGQRKCIKNAIKELANSLGDRCPPAESAVMHWMRKYERSDDNPYVLVTRRRLVRHKSSLSKFAEELIQEGIERIYLNRERHSAMRR
jgi:hypothetical protein